MPMEAGAGTRERGLQWQPSSLCTTQQWRPASMVAQASSTNIPGCGAPYTCPLGCLFAANSCPLPGSALQTPCCSTQPHSVPADVTQAGPCMAAAWTIHVGLTLSCLPQTCYCALLQASEAPSLSQLISPPVRGLL